MSIDKCPASVDKCNASVCGTLFSFFRVSLQGNPRFVFSVTASDEVKYNLTTIATGRAEVRQTHSHGH